MNNKEIWTLLCSQFDNLDEMDHFFEKHYLQKLTQNDNLNSSLSFKIWINN